MAGIRFGLDELFRRLHSINLYELDGHAHSALNAAEVLNNELEGSHLRVWFTTDGREWILQDTLIKDRENKEADSGQDA